MSFSKPMNVAAVLTHAGDVIEHRRGMYGDPVEFFTALAKRWSLTLGRPVTPAQVVLCMIDLKHQRLCHDAAHTDSIVDLAGYAGILSEIAR